MIFWDIMTKGKLGKEGSQDRKHPSRKGNWIKIIWKENKLI